MVNCRHDISTNTMCYLRKRSTDGRQVGVMLVATDPRMLPIAWRDLSAGRRRSQHASWLELAVGGLLPSTGSSQQREARRSRIYRSVHKLTDDRSLSAMLMLAGGFLRCPLRFYPLTVEYSLCFKL